uniref:Uncharacterized protein n=1 Tax=Octopus bimaculoides TaxID=37653 RepID=A0A0L8HQJ4_OCTBM
MRSERRDRSARTRAVSNHFGAVGLCRTTAVTCGTSRFINRVYRQYRHASFL